MWGVFMWVGFKDGLKCKIGFIEYVLILKSSVKKSDIWCVGKEG